MPVRDKIMTRFQLEKRTKNFAISVFNFIDNLPKSKASKLIAAQLLRSATSIGANYREANRAESRRDFIHKIAIVEKEAAESLYWIELFGGVMPGDADKIQPFWNECYHLVAIFTRIGKTSKQRLNSQSAFRNPQSESPS